MGRTHAQQLANHTLPRQLLADARPFLADPARALTAAWDAAAQDIAPIARMPAPAWQAPVVERRGLYSVVVITPPMPRVSGDAALIAIVGRGDGTTKLSTISYYVLEAHLDPSGGLSHFMFAARDGMSEHATLSLPGLLPDPRWLAEHAFAVYTGRSHAAPPTALPELPCWYWWHAFDGATAFDAFADARDDGERIAAVRRYPILLLPEIADAGEQLVGTKPARRLREVRPYVRRDPGMAAAYQTVIDRLASTSGNSPAAHTLRALGLIEEAGQHGAFSRSHAYEEEAVIRSKLVLLGIDVAENHELAHRAFAAAAAERQSTPRMARGSTPPPIAAEDPVWAPLFLDESELPQAARTSSDDTFSSTDSTFLAHGGIRAGYNAWSGGDQNAIAHVVDVRWVFRSAAHAAHYLYAMAPHLADGLPAIQAPQLGDDVLAFGDDTGSLTGRRMHVVVVRVGRVLARLQVTEGAHAAASRQMLHAALLHPLVQRIVQRARQGLAAYWLAVAYPSNTVPELVHSPGHDAARLIAKHPLLAHTELPSALATLGDKYAPVARSLASFQAQLRAHRWHTYRDAMRALVRMLLDTDMGDARVNASHAHEIVAELARLDPDPIWQQLDAECRARA